MSNDLSLDDENFSIDLGKLDHVVAHNPNTEKFNRAPPGVADRKRKLGEIRDELEDQFAVVEALYGKVSKLKQDMEDEGWKPNDYKTFAKDYKRVKDVYQRFQDAMDGDAAAYKEIKSEPAFGLAGTVPDEPQLLSGEAGEIAHNAAWTAAKTIRSGKRTGKALSFERHAEKEEEGMMGVEDHRDETTAAQNEKYAGALRRFLADRDKPTEEPFFAGDRNRKMPMQRNTINSIMEQRRRARRRERLTREAEAQRLLLAREAEAHRILLAREAEAQRLLQIENRKKAESAARKDVRTSNAAKRKREKEELEEVIRQSKIREAKRAKEDLEWAMSKRK